MNTEYEVKILEVDQEKLEKKILELGGEFVRNYDQKRYVYDLNPKEENKWIRLRNIGDETTLTIKNIINDSITGTKELEFKVEDFEKCNLFLKEIGFLPKGYQENRRVRYLLDGVEIDFDSWPHIPTYMEIEGADEESVKKIVQKLGMSEEDITTLNTQDIYLKYGFNLNDLEELKFEKEGI